MIVEAVAIVFGVLGVAFGVRSYVELRKWAKQCKEARIVVAYNRRVKMNAPLVEWLQWCNMLDKDESTTGRVVYMNGKTSIAIVRPKKNAPDYNIDRAARIQKKEAAAA